MSDSQKMELVPLKQQRYEVMALIVENVAKMDADELIMQKIAIFHDIEASGGFSQEYQISYLISMGVSSPKLLMEQLGIQKTNLSLLCKKLLDNKLISKMRSEDNKKQIAYCITLKGKNVLNTKIKSMCAVRKDDAKKVKFSFVV
jgi:DNA-binding MarR family transcriptional regulator